MTPGSNAFFARCSITTLSLPPENSNTGRLALGGDLADHEDRVGLELAQPLVEADPVGVCELGTGVVDHGHVRLLGRIG
jgi:hypothetical protein